MTDDTVLICACGRVWRGIKVGQDADAEIKRLQSQLCAAREAVRSKVIDALNRHQAPMEACQDVVDSIDAALSSSSSAPCLHAALHARVVVLEKGLMAVDGLIGESRGVDGLHLNGDVALWEDLRTGGVYEEWLRDYDAALDAAKEG